MTDHSEGKKKTNKWLWPLLGALVLVALLAWAFNRGADDGGLSERMASDPVSRQPINQGEPAPPPNGVSTLVPDNANGNASVITEADALRQNGGGSAPSATPQSDGRPGADAQGSPAPGQSNPPAAGQ